MTKKVTTKKRLKICKKQKALEIKNCTSEKINRTDRQNAYQTKLHFCY